VCNRKTDIPQAEDAEAAEQHFLVWNNTLLSRRITAKSTDILTVAIYTAVASHSCE